MGSVASITTGLARNFRAKSWTVIFGWVFWRTGAYVSGTRMNATGPKTALMIRVIHAVQRQPRRLSVTNVPMMGPSVGPA